MQAHGAYTYMPTTLTYAHEKKKKKNIQANQYQNEI